MKIEELFLNLVNLSITASYLVAAVLILRLVLRRAPRWMFCLLWGLVALRLVCPISVESAFSLIPSAEPLPREILYTAAPERTGSVTEEIGNAGEAGGFVNLALLDPALTAPVESGESHTQIWSFVLSRVWVAGMAAMLFYGVICYFLVHRRVAEATRLRGNIWQSEAIDSPFVLGLFRPMIYVTYKMEEGDLEYVLAHEQAHIRRGDHWWKPLGFALLAVYWFNPFLWAAYMVFCRDIETACDEKVIRSMEKEGRQAYSRALLHCGVRRRSIAACPLAFGEIGVKERIKAVMNYRKPAFWMILLAFAAIGVAAVCLLTNPVDSVGEEGDSSEKESQGETLEREEEQEDSSAASGQGGEGVDDDQEESAAASGQVKNWGELLWEEADLDRDGENESIYLQEVAEDMEYELNVVKADGTLLWSTWISTAHVGWNTILLLQESWGADYLVEYHPTMFQGYGDYWWSQFFWLDGEFQEFDSPSVEYTLLEATEEGGEGLPPEKYARLKAFESLTNRMLENAVLLVTSEQGELVTGPRKATELAQLYPVNYYGDYPKGDPGELALGEQLQFTFSSGAGAWATGLTLRSDGSFEGEYVDDDMGDAGEGYSGTEYLCSFTGRFGEIRKMGEYAYLMRLEELVCKEEEGREWIEGGTRYVASGPYGMEDGEEFLLYLPGVATDDLTDLCLSWWPGRFAVNSEGTPENLDCYILYNLNTGQGFFTD